LEYSHRSNIIASAHVFCLEPAAKHLSGNWYGSLPTPATPIYPYFRLNGIFCKPPRTRTWNQLIKSQTTVSGNSLWDRRLQDSQTVGIPNMYPRIYTFLIKSCRFSSYSCSEINSSSYNSFNSFSLFFNDFFLGGLTSSGLFFFP